MERQEFVHLRARIGKTQRELSQLLGVSLRAIHAYEQGWRSVPTAVSRQLLFLVSRKHPGPQQGPCWTVKNCPPERRNECPAWEFQSGDLCWFITGTLCSGRIENDWEAKLEVCRKCQVFRPILHPESGAPP